MVVPTMNERKRKHDSANNSFINEQDDDEELIFSDEEGAIRFEDIYIPPPSKPACSSEFVGPRLMITKISNNNFKSYANEVIIGPFHKCFNAIVGPNGSGKSNVIDSMLFVFGYRASKIRSKKLSVLIHNSEAHTNVQSCTVAVYFQLIIDKEGDDYDVVPDSEFIVSRTAFKDNSSYYQLDGKRVQFKEVALLLRKYHIDLDHNRFLILQGEVEQIAMMKPKAANEHESGMLEYLEDIIGTSRFKVPLLKVWERIEILDDQRLEKMNRAKLVEKEKNELEGPMKEAVSFLKLENDVVYKQNMLLQKQILDMNKQNSEQEEKKTKIETDIKQFDENLKMMLEEKTTKEKVTSEAAQKYNNLEKRRDELKAAFEKANNRDITVSEEMQQKNKRRKKNIELLKEERLKLEKLKCIPENNEASITDYSKREQEVTAEKLKLEEGKTKLLSALHVETKELRDKKEVLQTELIDLNKAVHETKSELSLTEGELKICQSNEENERAKLENLQAQHRSGEATLESNARTVQELKTKIPLTEKSVGDAERELQAVKLEEMTIVQELRKRRIDIEETRASMQATTSKNRVLDALMKQKRSGECAGLFGRLGDLGAIDKRYDVAVSTACGPLDNIVVDTVTTAQWCIEFLKRNDIGRATFIALEMQEHFRAVAAQPLHTPENVPRLYNLIRVEDERIAPAFYYALRDTLVAEDLDQASRIAYGKQRFRVVTLRGDLIETAGTMSGGGKSVLKGRMGQQVAVKSNVATPDQLAAMETDLKELEGQICELRRRQVTLEQQINTLQPQLQKMRIDLEKFSREIQSLREQKPTLEKQIKAQKLKSQSTKADAKQVEKLMRSVEAKSAAYAAAADKANQVQQQVNAITSEIDGRIKGKIKPVDQKIRQVADVINKCKAEITKLKVAIKTSERNCKKSADAIATMEQEIKETEDSLRAMKKERETIESDAAALMKCLENVAKELSEGENDYGDEKNAIDLLVKNINKVKGEKIELDQNLKTINKQISEQKVQTSQWKSKLAQLVVQEIPDECTEPLKEFSADEMADFNVSRLQREIGLLAESIKTSKPNLNAIKNYLHKKEQYMTRLKELEELVEKRLIVWNKREEWRKARLDEFLQGFSTITMKLKEMYQMITMGGDADLEFVDTFDPFNEGITFNVRPPKKTWKNISNLSGGEKTLSSLALVFALHYFKPSPLYVMDEIDAALDFKNVSIVGNYIKERTKNAQFIIISLRSNMFELCDYLVGIYKTHNCTHSLTIDPRSYDNNDDDDGAANEETNESDQRVPNIAENGNCRETAINGMYDNNDTSQNGQQEEEEEDMNGSR